ncbi:LEM domain-containing protein 1 isoform X1 [Takifugu flavidus]|uniref:LEM domain-containing protein 1 isoform X1 n=1 Tax=Takifugu flavidus TaxID=433684 RepID=UPI002544C34F|nr:LEM domain-containing protein 1 isoform X1 [Takifugu flavidus]XP_056896088.1 LEM domain-containing protein 1 isoform X1 [Takifugu flavidus]XP_056896089.1 LEM domain-containing protein 1 isoform X1 [Takifugu flavidus]
MPLLEDPARLSKSRLKSDLLAHNVALPPANSRKDVYVELHLKHIEQKDAAEFSSDEEDRGQDEAEDEVVDGDDPGGRDPSALTDDGLKAALIQHGVKVGPIVASTRAVYEKKLRKLLESGGHDEQVNGEEGNAVLYSDSEDEEGSKGAKGEGDEHAEHSQQDMSQNNNFAYPQCFILSSKLRAPASETRKPCPAKNPKNALKSSERGPCHCSRIPAGISRASSVNQRSGLGSRVPNGLQPAKSIGCSSGSSQAFSITQMVEEMESRRSVSDTESNGSDVQELRSQPSRLLTVDQPAVKNQTLFYTPEAFPVKPGPKPPVEPVNGVSKDIFPAQASPTGIYATRRRPIKGAAGRPVQYVFPDTPTSPATLERREAERRLVPIHIQILVFLIVVVLLYLVSVVVEDSSLDSAMSLLDSPNQASDVEEFHAPEAPAFSEQE